MFVPDLPVVSCEWLLACYKYGKRLPVKNHLVGDSISPVDDVPDTELVPLELEPEPQLVESVIEDVPPHMAGKSNVATETGLNRFIVLGCLCR